MENNERVKERIEKAPACMQVSIFGCGFLIFFNVKKKMAIIIDR